MAARKAAKKGRGAKSARKAATKPSRRRAAGGRKVAEKAGRRPQGQTSAPAKKSATRLYTLTEIGKLASVSMPTLQKYKRLYAERIPSVGEGRRQRYPRAAVAVLRQLKKENLAKRGRPPKSGVKGKKTTTARKRATSKSSAGLLTLTEIARRTKISYPTLSRYVRLFIDRIPHEGSGRSRRFPVDAVAVFRQLRAESRPGRPPAGGKPAKPSRKGSSSSSLEARIRDLERAQTELAKQVANVARLLKKPLQVTIKGR